MPKNSLITQGTIYGKCYDALRGVDFSSDHTQVNEHRFAYLCNMWKDYKSAQGNGVETIPGYRKLVANAGGKINGFHERRYIENGVAKTDLYIHAGETLRAWTNFPSPQGVQERREYVLGNYTQAGQNKNFTISVSDCYDVLAIEYDNIILTQIGFLDDQQRTWSDALQQYSFSFTWSTSLNVDTGSTITLLMIKYPVEMPIVYSSMANHESISFSFNNYLYILDGTHFLKCNGTTVTDIEDDAYVPTIYINGIPSGVNATIGKEYEQRNMLSSKFKQTFVADGTTTDYQLALSNLEDITSIKVYGKEKAPARILSAETILARIRESFQDFETGDFRNRFEVVRTTNNKWVIAVWDDVEEDWVEYSEEYTAEQLSLYAHEDSVYAKPGFVTVDADTWFASDIGSARYGDIVFRFVQSDEWEYWNSLTPDYVYKDLRADYGVQYTDEEEAYFVNDQSDAVHGYLHVISEQGTTEVIFNLVVENGAPTLHMEYGNDDVTFNTETGIVKFPTAPTAPEDTEQEATSGDSTIRYYPEGYAGIEITAKKQVTKVNGLVDESVDIPNIIKACTMVCMFDGRVFLSGNPKYPNNVFWCGRNADTGLIDPSYWGLLNYVTDGVETIPIKAMLPVADTLAVIKGDTAQDGSVFYHTAYETGEDLIPVTYPSKQGLAGVGCTGAAFNFIDDPVFVSKNGVEAIGQLSVRLERALEHRSTLVDAKLLNLDLSKARLCEWEGYLILSIEGKVFMADSRQAYANDQGVKEYEWYYLEGLGEYVGQSAEYRFATEEEWNEHVANQEIKVTWTDSLGTSHELTLEAAPQVYDPETYSYIDLTKENANDYTINTAEVSVYNVYGTQETKTMHYVVLEFQPTYQTDDATTYGTKTYRAFYVVPTGAMQGGTYHPAILMKSIGGLLLFGTDTGAVFCFNTDKRNEDGSIDAQWYSFDGRTIECGCATKMDNCGIPHLTKTTVKKSIVLKTKNYDVSAAKIKVRTNRNVFNQVARINSMQLDFEKMDFADFSLSGNEKDLFAIKEKERRWVEKQYYIYSDEYCRPFALYYLAYRYFVIGRYKNR